jgi:predicted anti-sigma-YlaC factor YlaD
MLTCDVAEHLIARYVDGVLADVDRARLDEHLQSCTTCRTALDAQAAVAALLRARAPERRADLVSKVSARLDEESGVFGLANWRAWTLGLAPVAAALMLAAYLGIGAAASSATQPVVAAEDWPASASVLMQPGTSGDALVEAVLTGTAVSGAEGRDVR